MLLLLKHREEVSISANINASVTDTKEEIGEQKEKLAEINKEKMTQNDCVVVASSTVRDLAMNRQPSPCFSEVDGVDDTDERPRNISFHACG